MTLLETNKVKSSAVYCSGKDFPYDHPKVYLKIDANLGSVKCPYCSKKFELEN